jgi:hypothetical protein
MTTKSLMHRLPVLAALTSVADQFPPTSTPEKIPAPRSNALVPAPDQQRHTMNRRSLLMNMITTAFVPAALAAAPVLPTAAESPEVDPIFELIGQHRAAVAEYIRAETISGDALGAERETAWAVTSAAMDRSGDLLEALLRARPTTLNGAVSLLEYLGQDEFLGGASWESFADDRETLLSTFNNCTSIERKRLAQDLPARLAAALRNIVNPLVSPVVALPVDKPSSDAELFKLIDERRVAQAESERAYRAFEPFEQKAFEQQRKRHKRNKKLMPEALRVRPGDVELGLPQPYDGIYDRINDLREETWLHGSSKKENGVTTMSNWRVTPSAEARTRADEIIAADEKWSALKSRRPRGFRRAERAYQAALDKEWDIQTKIEKTPAKTVSGLIAKARVIAEPYGADSIDPDEGIALLNNLLAFGKNMPET